MNRPRECPTLHPKALHSRRILPVSRHCVKQLLLQKPPLIRDVLGCFVNTVKWSAGACDRRDVGDVSPEPSAKIARPFSRPPGPTSVATAPLSPGGPGRDGQGGKPIDCSPGLRCRWHLFPSPSLAVPAAPGQPRVLRLHSPRARKWYDDAAKERQKVRKGNQPGATPANLPDLSTGDARDAAGKAVGVSGRSIDYAPCRSGPSRRISSISRACFS